jgi:predicted nucleotidyltransferase
MLTITEAFRKFRSGLELTQGEQDDASRRQQEIREVMAASFKIARDFLSGSYARWTKTKPLKDVDIFCVLHDDERATYRNNKAPGVLLDKVEKVLVEKYGRENVKRQRRSISVEFPIQEEEGRVMSFDVVPAFTKSSHYEIPDERNPKGWTETDPEVHAEMATAANKAFSGEWKGMVRMLKAWNRENGSSVKPSFLLEVMAHALLRPPFQTDYPLEFMGFFATAERRIHDTWEEPAKLGPPVSDSMDQVARSNATAKFRDAQYAVRAAVNLSEKGQNGEALRAYRKLFGPLFPLS